MRGPPAPSARWGGRCSAPGSHQAAGGSATGSAGGHKTAGSAGRWPGGDSRRLAFRPFPPPSRPANPRPPRLPPHGPFGSPPRHRPGSPGPGRTSSDRGRCAVRNPCPTYIHVHDVHDVHVHAHHVHHTYMHTFTYRIGAHRRTTRPLTGSRQRHKHTQDVRPGPDAGPAAVPPSRPRPRPPARRSSSAHPPPAVSSPPPLARRPFAEALPRGRRARGVRLSGQRSRSGSPARAGGRERRPSPAGQGVRPQGGEEKWWRELRRRGEAPGGRRGGYRLGGEGCRGRRGATGGARWARAGRAGGRRGCRARLSARCRSRGATPGARPTRSRRTCPGTTSSRKWR